MKDFETNLKNITKVLTEEYFYKIPNYQRPYSWEKDQCDKLLQDLLESYNNNREQAYFCGSIVILKDSDDNRFEVIDGQQRLTTFIILLAVLRDFYKEKLNSKSSAKIKDALFGRYEENDRIKLLTDLSRQCSFQNILRKIDFYDNKESRSNKYLQNAHVLKDFLSENTNQYISDINDFIDWLFQNVDFVFIEVNNLDNGIKIFNVLNDRGLPLKPVNILKSNMMKSLNDEDRTIFAATWDNIYREVESNDEILDRVLNFYTFYAITDNPPQRYDKVLLETFTKNKKTMLDEINEIQKFVGSYKIVAEKETRSINLLRYIRWQYWLPILIIAQHVDYSDFDKLADILVAYYYQNWIAGHTLTKIKQTSFNIMKAVKNKDNISIVKDLCKTNLDKSATTNKFKLALDGEVDTESWIRPILCLLEYYRLDDNRGLIELARQPQLEHILPQTIESTKWAEDYDLIKFNQNVHKLGNLTLLSLKKNIQAYNIPFESKKEVYANKDNQITSFAITQDILQYKTWKEEDIKSRQHKIVGVITEKLNIF